MDLIILEKLGKGNYGSVYKVQDKNSSNIFALKIVQASKLKYIELDILTRIKNPYLIRSFGNPIVETLEGTGFTMNVVNKSLNNVDLKDYSYGNLKRIIVSVLYGLRCMHDKGFIHMDIALRNIMYGYDSSNNILGFLGDFGFSVKCDNAYKGIECSKYVKNKSIPYEVVKNLEKNKTKFKYSDKTDIWSLGICILEMIGTRIPSFKSLEKHLEYVKNINDTFIEERVKLYNKNKMSKKEEIYLKELLVHMLEKNPSKRISSKNIEKLNFMKTEIIDKTCILEKPSELLALPYISKSVYDGLTHINNFFRKNAKLYNIRMYFLAIQLFLRIMAKSTPNIEETTLKYICENCINSALNYYGRKETTFYIAKELKGEVGYNPMYYEAKYIDDLVVINNLIMSNKEYIISSLNTINMKELFTYFKEKYIYNTKRKDAVTLEEFFQMEIPEVRDNYKTDKLAINDYIDLTDSEISTNYFEQQKKIEDIFRSILVDKIKENVKKENNVDILDIVEKIKKNPKESKKYPKLQEKNFIEKFVNVEKNFSYGIFSKKTKINTEFKFVVCIIENKTSLLYVDKNSKSVTHYYSDKVEEVENYYKSIGYKYKIDFDHGSGFTCKIMESCIIFNIFYNNYNNVLDFKLKCLEPKTLEVMFMFLLC